MLSPNGNLQIMPLYWVFHDFWEYTKTHKVKDQYGGYRDVPVYGYHRGHVHFFMPTFDIQNAASQQAYFGKQVYSFSLDEIWGPKSKDKNQQNNLRVVGKPKWYFYVEEFWRRIYLQQWDYVDNNYNRKTHLGKRGIKWDAASPVNREEANTYGPFREFKGNYFYDTNLARTLPIEYWKDEKKSIRDHYLRYGSNEDEGWNVKEPLIWDYNKSYPVNIKTPVKGDQWTDCYTDWDPFTLPRTRMATGDYSFLNEREAQENRYLTFSDEDKARNTGFPDRYYLCPTLEYVCSKQLDFERLPGWEDRDSEDELTGEEFGDGYEAEISIPYTENNVIQSPFSENSIVAVPGNYYHEIQKSENTSGVCEERRKFERLKFRNDGYLDEGSGNNEKLTKFYPKIEECGKDAYWNIPSGSGWQLDGMWVEQCLGAFVQAKVKIITEDKMGGRTVNWVTASSLEFQDPFEGVDNLKGPEGT